MELGRDQQVEQVALWHSAEQVRMCQVLLCRTALHRGWSCPPRAWPGYLFVLGMREGEEKRQREKHGHF
jgi:hypothetical protein